MNTETFDPLQYSLMELAELIDAIPDQYRMASSTQEKRAIKNKYSLYAQEYNERVGSKVFTKEYHHSQ